MTVKGVRRATPVLLTGLHCEQSHRIRTHREQRDSMLYTSVHSHDTTLASLCVTVCVCVYKRLRCCQALTHIPHIHMSVCYLSQPQGSSSLHKCVKILWEGLIPFCRPELGQLMRVKLLCHCYTTAPC